MTVVLVTVAGPSGRRDLAVPADVPVADLLGQVVAAAVDGRPGTTGQDRWRLALPGGDPLPPERSLAASGVGDGAVLTLTLDAPPASRVAAPRLGRCVVVGVLSATAEAGRATVAALLAAVLAATRQDLVVAVDTRPEPGSLTDRLPPDLDVPAVDLLGLLDHPALTTGELLACLAARPSRGSGSRSASPALVAGGRALAPLLQGLARHVGALVLDCGAGLGGPAGRAAVAAADQLVLVTEPAPSAASRRVAAALVDLGHAVVVAAGSPSAGALAQLPPGVRGVVALPYPAPAGPPREWAEVPSWWRRPALQLAYLLAADWPALGLAPGVTQTRRPGRPNGLPQAQPSAILQPVDVWPSGREPVR